MPNIIEWLRSWSREKPDDASSIVVKIYENGALVWRGERTAVATTDAAKIGVAQNLVNAELGILRRIAKRKARKEAAPSKPKHNPAIEAVKSALALIGIIAFLSMFIWLTPADTTRNGEAEEVLAEAAE